MGDESLLISLAGTLAGIGAGLLIGVVWVIGMQGTSFPGMTMHLPIATLAVIAVAGVLMGVAAAILPARRAARLDPLAAPPLRRREGAPRRSEEQMRGRA